MSIEKKYSGFITDEKKSERSFWEEKSSTKKRIRGNKKQYSPLIFLIIMILLSALILSGSYIYVNKQNLFPKKLTEDSAKSVNTPQPFVSSSPVSESKVNKDEIKITIFNASGVKGQAGKTKELLEKLGFKGIETGNADDPQEVTEVEFGANIVEEVRKEVRESLEKIYQKVEEKDNKKTTLIIKITTGKVK